MDQPRLYRLHIAILIVLWAAIHAMLFWHFGMRLMYDSVGYIRNAHYLLDHGSVEDVRVIFYLVPVSLVAFFIQWVPGGIVSFLIFQSVLSGGGMLSLYYAGKKLFRSSGAGFVSAVIFLLWWDNLHWDVTVMTESLLCTFTCFLIGLVVYFDGTRRHYFFMALISTVIFFTRPTGLVVLAGVVGFLLCYHWSFFKFHPFRKIALAAGLILITVIGTSFMFSQWDFTVQYSKGNIVTYMDNLVGDPLYRESLRLDTSDLKLAPADSPSLLKIPWFIAHNPGHFFHAAFLKVTYLMTAVRPYYSTLHNTYIVVWMLVIYLFFGMGWRKANNRMVKAGVFLIIMMNCILIAISTVDWDNRFYIPMEPGIVLLAGGGGVALLEKLKSHFTKS